MAEKLPVNTGNTFWGKKLWQKHQENEYTKVDNYKEGQCFLCFKRKDVSAMVIDICADCANKKGPETVLTLITEKFYGMCFFCGLYKFKIENLNVRICRSCFGRMRKHLKAYNKAGGPYGADPFHKHLRRKWGKDWKILTQTPKAFRV